MAAEVRGGSVNDKGSKSGKSTKRSEKKETKSKCLEEENSCMLKLKENINYIDYYNLFLCNNEI